MSDGDSTPRAGGEPGEDVEDVRVLMIDDDEDDFLIAREMLARQDVVSCHMDWRSDYASGLNEIRRRGHDVYLVDYRLGQRTGLELIREGFASRPYAPAIMLTGQPTYEISLEATALGVTEFLVKNELKPTRLAQAIQHSINHQKAERYASAARSSDDGIWDWDLRTDRIYVSARWRAMLGWPELAGETTANDVWELIAADDRARLRDAIDEHLAGRTPKLACEHRMRHRDGSWRWLITSGVATRDSAGAAVQLAGSISDMTDRRVEQLRLEHEALHDPLTGLPNRSLVTDRLRQTLSRSARDASAGCALLFLDLDGFKEINDTYGHVVGDHLLAGFAERVRRALRPGDTLARLGGDEFLVLAERLTQPREASAIAERILRSLRTPFMYAGHELAVATSIGIALSAPDLEAAELIELADLAMYDAKRRGPNGWAVFTQSSRPQTPGRGDRRDEVREVVAGGMFDVRYEPVVDLHAGRPVGFEAVAHWPDELPPLDLTEFHAIVDAAGVELQLAECLLRTALGDLCRWRDEGLASADLWVSLGLSPRAVTAGGLAELARHVSDARITAGCVRPEVDDSSLLILDTAASQRRVAETTSFGLHVADFGSGHSSLEALHRLPIRALKLRVEDRDPRFVRTAAAVAQSLDAALIATGVPPAWQSEKLCALGCGLAQGEGVSPALSAAGVALLLGAGPPGDRAAPR